MTQHSPASQCAMILSDLKRDVTLTARMAQDLYGCDRLAARIHDLKKDKWPIWSERIPVGQGKYVAQYSLDQNRALWPDRQNGELI